MAEPRVRRPHRAVVLTISLLFAALLASGCSDGGGGGDDGEGRRGGGGGGGDRSGREVALDVRIGKVAGKLPKRHRSRVARQVGGVVDRWFEAAYVGGDYPRKGFGKSWPQFTRDTRRQAVGDRFLTSNAGIGPSTRSVQAVRKRAHVDVLAWNGKPHAATARFALVFDAQGKKRTARHKVGGRLMLVLDSRRKWRVVGYDVSRSSKVRGGGKS